MQTVYSSGAEVPVYNTTSLYGVPDMDAKVTTLRVVAACVDSSVHPCTVDSTSVDACISTTGSSYEQRCVGVDGTTYVGGSTLWPKASDHGVPRTQADAIVYDFWIGWFYSTRIADYKHHRRISLTGNTNMSGYRMNFVDRDGTTVTYVSKGPKETDAGVRQARTPYVLSFDQ